MRIIGLEKTSKDEKNFLGLKPMVWKILVGGLALVLSVGAGWFFYRKQEKGFLGNKKSSVGTSSPPEVEVFLPTKADFFPQKDYFLPVREEMVRKGKVVRTEYGVDDWGVMLPAEEKVFAGFSGRASWSGTGELKIIILESDDGKSEWRYLLNGEVLIERAQRVEKGQEIGKAGPNPIPTYDVNLIIEASYDGKRTSIDL